MDPEPQPSLAAEWRTIPNLLSFGRLAATPVLGWLIVSGHTNYATGLFGAMGVSDYFDGYIARRTNTITDLGTTLDPVSDRVLAMTALVTMMIADILPIGFGVPVLFRDAALSIVFLFVARRGFGKPKVLRVGKSATFALFTALPALLLGGIMRTVGLALFAIGGILYYVAAYRYAKDVRRFLAHERRPFTEGTPVD
ncbi:MAG TPA: CDP-alcohol phosphatidyltransferase family protein [Actinomycetota bacterium]|nr:CDP-alcohol phosphatidyltransferase family protein [Actinomycetota bacterium]